MELYGMRAEESRGRRYPEGDPFSRRDAFERDTDRIIHSRAFKRLAGKTQVITGRRSDHHRTRLTHSVEVAALCRSLAGRLGVNPSLSACLGYCHDLGHPPLGHAGEDVLNEICSQFGGSFEHNRHTLTIVDEFEQKYASCPGLNLSFEVREGIIKHSGDVPPPSDPLLAEFDFGVLPPVEAQLVDTCDEICYTYSDLDDALEGGYVSLEREILPEIPAFASVYSDMRGLYPHAERRLLFNETLRRLMNGTVVDLENTVLRRIGDLGIATVQDVRTAGERLVGCSDDMRGQMLSLKRFLSSKYYGNPKIQVDRAENMEKIRKLFGTYMDDNGQLPQKYKRVIDSGALPAHRVIVYFIAGFTDFYFFQMVEKFKL